MIREELVTAIQENGSWQDITKDRVRGKEIVFQKGTVRLLLLPHSVGFAFFCSDYNVGTIYLPYQALRLSETGLLSGEAGDDIDIAVRL